VSGKKIIGFNEVHVRKACVVIGWGELQEIISEEIMRRAGLRHNRGLTIKCRAEDVMEGSPPYKVGMKVIVEVEQDMLPQLPDEAPL
jgi:hypothetical protein